MLASEKRPRLNFVREGKKYAMTMKIPNHIDQSIFPLKKNFKQPLVNGKNVHINLFSLLKIFVSVEN